MPDIIHVFLNGAVRRELSDLRRVQHGHASPLLLIPVQLLDPLLSLGVGSEILQDEELVRSVIAAALKQRIVQLPEQLGILRRIEAIDHLGHNLADLGINVINLLRSDWSSDVCSSELHILLADLFRHLNIRAVHRADGDRAVKHELHIAGS